MPSTVRPPSPETLSEVPAKKSRALFNIQTDKDGAGVDQIAPQQQQNNKTSSLGRSSSLARKGMDTARNQRKKFRGKRRSSITEADFDFFEREAILVDDDLPTDQRAQVVEDTADRPRRMLKNLDNTPFRTRLPVRIDAEDGPWSMSVAESPHDANAYCLYIRTPTHNLTLTRTAVEIVELDGKLRDGYPNVKVPALPIDAKTLPVTTPTKRKSTFLNTLSRLTSPGGKVSRSSSMTRRNTTTSGAPPPLPTPLPSAITPREPSPAADTADPFSEFAANDDTLDDPGTSLPAPSAISTALATYFTSVSNTPTLRSARVWKRFVRVRTDDLESVRVERAIKRVRSDLAAHLGLAKGGSAKEKENREAPTPSPAPTTTTATAPGSADASARLSRHESRADTIAEEDAEESNVETKVDGEDVRSDVKTEEEAKAEDAAEEATVATEETATPAPDTDDQKTEEDPKTPSAADAPSNRIHRSQSADLDTSSRLSRTYTSSTSAQEGGVSSQTETGDDSSVSTSHKRRARKKRSMSMDPNRELKKRSQRKVSIDDFELLRVLGKGCAGKVLLVRYKSSGDLYALKAITKRHVLAHQELQHTLTEQAVLKRMAADSKDPFVVKLWWSFHDKENLFLVMDFHPGGDLATQLARWGRLGRDRARFYAAEIVEGVEGLHAAGVIYRDLKPENILIGADGHIVLTDFGLSKEFPRKSSATTAPATPSGTSTEFYTSSSSGHVLPATPPWMKMDKNGELALGWPGQPIGHMDSTTTFCGTAEYLAPEVIQGQVYSYEIDWWSFGTMLFEMLTGITPFWAQNHSDMYIRVLQDELQFPDDRAIDQDTKSLIRGLLQKNPALRICEPRIKRHPYFSMIDWSHVYYKRYIPPYIPPIDPSNASDTQNFDDTFLGMQPVLDDPYENEQTDTDQEQATDTDRTDAEETNTTPSQSRSSSVQPRPAANGASQEDDGVDVFDGYSFKGRHSVLIDDEDEEEETDEETDEDDAEDVLKKLDAALEGAKPAPTEVEEITEETAEPKTPEARPKPLPAEPEPERQELQDTKTPEVHSRTSTEAPAEAQPAEAKPRKSKDLVRRPVSVVMDEQAGRESPSGKPPVPPKSSKIVNRNRNRREKSGIPALDRTLPDPGDETDVLREEDDDWDLIEADGGEDRNGAKGTSLFARGVVDRYRLAVFRKGSTPTQSRTVSSYSREADADPTTSPTPSQRRGRNPGLQTFRKNTRQFLKPKSPPSSYSSKVSMTASNSATLSAASSKSSTGHLSSTTSGTAFGSPSLKTKESATSVGNQSSSDQSLDAGDSASPSDAKESPVDEKKTKKLKKYKENAEKMLSIFASSPRHPPHTAT